MLVEFWSHPDGAVVAIETNEVRTVIAARGDMALTLIRLSGGEDVVVRGSKDEVAARLNMTEEWKALRAP